MTGQQWLIYNIMLRYIRIVAAPFIRISHHIRFHILRFRNIYLVPLRSFENSSGCGVSLSASSFPQFNIWDYTCERFLFFLVKLIFNFYFAFASKILSFLSFPIWTDFLWEGERLLSFIFFFFLYIYIFLYHSEKYVASIWCIIVGNKTGCHIGYYTRDFRRIASIDFDPNAVDPHFTVKFNFASGIHIKFDTMYFYLGGKMERFYFHFHCRATNLPFD